MIFDIKKIDTFPKKPGVYLMKNRWGTILYIGKAKNLRQRVKQYFVPGRDGRFMVPFLVSKVTDVETIVVTSEKEALLLENTLIKKHQPRYNVLLKDDKSYIALKLTKHRWPMLQLVRYKGKPKADGQYFGPYTSAYAARQTFDLINKLFPLRQCSDQELARRTRPCILYSMKRCIAPCVGYCTEQEYSDHVDHTVKFLRGQDKEILRDLRHQMEGFSENLEFEKAAAVHKTIQQIETTVEKQHVDKPLGVDVDAVGVYRQGDEVIVCQLLYRGGKLIGSSNHSFSEIAQDDSELVASFLVQRYEAQTYLPHEILVPIKVDQAQDIEEVIAAKGQRRVQIISPKRGEKVKLIEMANVNAKAAFAKEKDARAIRERTLLEMQEKLRLKRYPRRIECFDNSNISGTEPVSSMVVFIEGEKDKKRYRKYKVKTVDRQDDYATMYEVLMRRYRRGKEENDLPDLIIIDGGKGHLNVALKVLEELNIITIDVIGIAKEEARHDKGMTAEQVFLPNVKDPIHLKKSSSILFLLQQIRDEAHRTAVSFHRQRRSKRVIHSALDDIPGIGPAKKKALMKRFGSVKRIKEADISELCLVKGITKELAVLLKKTL
ncbi:MAG: excinuclease ABC subunit UvrC [Chlamydiales bacterium]|nr:excinuclease ABC subunit UvrC [Chlamydiia bacterium]MCP5508464.1 excinuclease ABC subunit UvrC [Chlamydiales bacterium]